MSRHLHLVYIHGFRGDESTFQAFPTHLQQFVADHIPKHLDMDVNSSLYPTYKSTKPISFATHNFIAWLRIQPPGPVILLAHSMGGLLAAEAVTHSYNAEDGSKRIIGMVAFDCPYLGMHPRVVITGLGSLFPKKTNSDMKTESELNPHPSIHIVNQNETDSLHESSPSRPLNPSGSTFTSSLSSDSTHSNSKSLIDRTMKFVSSHSDDALVRWARKHSGEPFTAGKRLVVDHFQFGSCMFDPSGLKDRYATLVAWNGLWVNYWTMTRSQSTEHRNGAEDKEFSGRELEDNDAALVEIGIAGTPSVTTTSNEHKAREKELKQAAKERKAKQKETVKKDRVKAGRHFVVLPTGLGAILGGGDKWEKVVIDGVDDEVAAHCGLFIPGQNLDYDGLVQRVGFRIIEWCNRSN
ncbi:hypothetical protein D9757_000924 [Collybiopsis confluens]|uniref:AB hydrolase-1 domain-containing protein n=1 Tax=Collybiopsis confluens TaxID=2823264 RepID=A0A8H5I0G7_9AGAR|nr:hypothetical protein D9757_000924 [Collybiopsis confluens]